MQMKLYCKSILWYKWLYDTSKWFITLNPSKCQHLRITLKKNIAIFSYTKNNTSIDKVCYHKHLVVIYDEKVSFNDDHDYYFESFQKILIFKNNLLQIGGQTFLKLYKSYILSVLEFSNLYLTPNIFQIKSFKKVQKKVTKDVCFKLSS